MLEELIFKFICTPENIIGLILNILGIIGLIQIFKLWGEKWYKSLIPYYGTYIIFKHTWKKSFFIVFIIFSILKSISFSFLKKDIFKNIIDSIKIYHETQQIDINISIPLIISLLILFFISFCIVFFIERIAIMKICNTFKIKNILLKIGTFILPELFLIIIYKLAKEKS